MSDRSGLLPKSNMARGGKREGAGRKAIGRRRHDAPHRTRPALSANHPVHVVLRSKRQISFRQRRTYHVLRGVLCAFLGRDDFRIVHISIQDNHLHLIVEAQDKGALAAGMKSFAIRAARALNRDDGGCGKVFAYRYYASQVTTARYARHALAYVLNNWRRHRKDFECGAARAASLDPYSSGASFTGWTVELAMPGYAPLPVSPPATRLLQSHWLRYGRIDPFERPGPLG
jgi:REP element-mobilizing transposase RayT